MNECLGQYRSPERVNGTYLRFSALSDLCVVQSVDLLLVHSYNPFGLHTKCLS